VLSEHGIKIASSIYYTRRRPRHHSGAGEGSPRQRAGGPATEPRCRGSVFTGNLAFEIRCSRPACRSELPPIS